MYEPPPLGREGGWIERPATLCCRTDPIALAGAVRSQKPAESRRLDTELTLHDYLNLLRRRAWVVALVLIATIAAALAYSALKTPLYRSSAKILINQNTTANIFDPVSGVPVSYAVRLGQNEVQLLRSELVGDEAEGRLGFDAREDVSVSIQTNADVLIVSGVSEDPAQAQLVAQTFAESYIDVRREQYISERLDTAAKLLDRIGEIDVQIQAADAATDIARLEALRSDLADSFDRLSITADLADAASARIIDSAPRPTVPFEPRTTRNLALGGVLGLMMGVGAALLLESLDRSVKTRQAIEKATPGVPALALLPSLQSPDGVVTIDRPNGVEAEAFRSLRAALEFAEVDRKIQVIQVTSPSAAAGKTTVAANLAVVMAQSGHRVVVVDADLRRPRLHALFGAAQVPGLTSVVLGRTDLADSAVVLDTGNGRLSVLPSGPVPPGPSELLGSDRAAKTFTKLREYADVVIIDCPPVLPVADALVLSRYADATVLVANARLTKRDALEHSVDQLRQAGAPLIGTVLNQVGKRGLTGYGYGYGYGYGGEEAQGPRLKRRGSSAAPQHAGTEVLHSSELPRFEAASASEREKAASSSSDQPDAAPKSRSASRKNSGASRSRSSAQEPKQAKPGISTTKSAKADTSTQKPHSTGNGHRNEQPPAQPKSGASAKSPASAGKASAAQPTAERPAVDVTDRPSAAFADTVTAPASETSTPTPPTPQAAEPKIDDRPLVPQEVWGDEIVIGGP